MLIIRQRILKGHEVIGYTLEDDAGMHFNCSIESVKQRVKAGIVKDVKLVGDSLTGVNGFQLRDLPSIQAEDARKKIEQEKAKRIQVQSEELRKKSEGLTLTGVYIFGDTGRIRQGENGRLEHAGAILGYRLKNCCMGDITINNKKIPMGQEFTAFRSKLASVINTEIRLTNAKFGADINERKSYLYQRIEEHGEKAPEIQIGFRDVDGKWKLLPEYKEFRTEIPGQHGLLPIKLIIAGNTNKITQVYDGRNDLSEIGTVIAYVFRNTDDEDLTFEDFRVASNEVITLRKSQLKGVGAALMGYKVVENKRLTGSYKHPTDAGYYLQPLHGSADIESIERVGATTLDEFGTVMLNKEYESLDKEFKTVLNESDDKAAYRLVAEQKENTLQLISEVWAYCDPSYNKLGYTVKNVGPNSLIVGNREFPVGKELFLTRADAFDLSVHYTLPAYFFNAFATRELNLELNDKSNGTTIHLVLKKDGLKESIVEPNINWHTFTLTTGNLSKALQEETDKLINKTEKKPISMFEMFKRKGK